jgi:hypothetical protein
MHRTLALLALALVACDPLVHDPMLEARTVQLEKIVAMQETLIQEQATQIAALTKAGKSMHAVLRGGGEDLGPWVDATHLWSEQAQESYRAVGAALVYYPATNCTGSPAVVAPQGVDAFVAVTAATSIANRTGVLWHPDAAPPQTRVTASYRALDGSCVNATANTDSVLADDTGVVATFYSRIGDFTAALR